MSVNSLTCFAKATMIKEKKKHAELQTKQLISALRTQQPKSRKKHDEKRSREKNYMHLFRCTLTFLFSSFKQKQTN
jgi:hypothetical protein